MNLRNKQTGGLANMLVEQDFIRVETDAGWVEYNSLAELNKYWEDDIIEPLIKDKKIRKAIRAWADASDVENVYFDDGGYRISDTDGSADMRFYTHPVERIDFEKEYTINELCGEEDE